MNRIEFMDQLKDLLREISAEEREEALQYYEDYFALLQRAKHIRGTTFFVTLGSVT